MGVCVCGVCVWGSLGRLPYTSAGLYPQPWLALPCDGPYTCGTLHVQASRARAHGTVGRTFAWTANGESITPAAAKTEAWQAQVPNV